MWITELQAEPWEPGKLVHLEKENAVTCSPESFNTLVKQVKSMKIETVLLWGVEYWIYRKNNFQDTSWIDQVKDLTQDNRI